MPGQSYGHVTAYLQSPTLQGKQGLLSCVSCCSPKCSKGCLRVAFNERHKRKARYAYTEMQTSNKEGFTHPLQGGNSSQQTKFH